MLTLVRVAASLGVDKIRLTGGEPTIRRGVVDLVRAIKGIPGIERVVMTTNGVKLDELAEPLARGGPRPGQHQHRLAGPGEVPAHHPARRSGRCVARDCRGRGGRAGCRSS